MIVVPAHAHVHLLHPVWAHGLTNQQPKKLISLSLSLSQDLRRQEVKYRIYYLRDDDLGSITADLYVYTTCKCPLLTGFCNLSKSLVFAPVATCSA